MSLRPPACVRACVCASFSSLLNHARAAGPAIRLSVSRLLAFIAARLVARSPNAPLGLSLLGWLLLLLRSVDIACRHRPTLEIPEHLLLCLYIIISRLRLAELARASPSAAMPAIPSPNNLSSNPPHLSVLSPPPASSPTIRDASTQPETLAAVAPRAAATPGGFVAIPTTYGSLHNSLSPGTIVGIVLGSVGGFLFLLFFLYACLGCGGATPFALILGRGGVEVEEDGVEEEVEVRRGRSGKKRHKRHHHRPRTAETYEVRTTRERVVREEPPAIVVEPRRQQAPPPQQVPPPPRVVPDDDSEDEVIVYEEEESEREAPRRRSRRSTSRRSDERARRTSGYRPVDPERYGGGGASMRDVPRRSGSRRDRDY